MAGKGISLPKGSNVTSATSRPKRPVVDGRSAAAGAVQQTSRHTAAGSTGSTGAGGQGHKGTVNGNTGLQGTNVA